MYNVPTLTAERNHNLAFWLWMLKSVVIVYLLNGLVGTLWQSGIFRTNMIIASVFISLFQTIVIVVVEWLIIRYFFPTIHRWLLYTGLIRLGIPLILFVTFSPNRSSVLIGAVESFLQLSSSVWVTIVSIILTTFLPVMLAAIAQSWLLKNHVDRPFRWLLAILIATTITMMFSGLAIYAQFEKIALLELVIRYGWIIGFATMLLTSLLPALVLRQFVIERNRVPAPV